MAKRKPVQAAASTTLPPPPSNPEPPQRLTYKQEKFVHEYVRNGGNGARAAQHAYPGMTLEVAASMAAENLRKPHIAAYLEQWREEARAAARFTRDDAIAILVGMATATQDDFCEVLRRPGDEDSYTGLGYKKHAIKGVSESFKNGNSVQLVDKKAVIDDLWDKLGLDKEASAGDRISFLERFARLGKNLGRGGASGEPGSGEGSK